MNRVISAILVGTLFVRTQLAHELVGLVMIPFTSLAVPAAGNTLHNLLPFAHLARHATHRAWKSGVTRLPSHDVHLRRRRKTNAVKNCIAPVSCLQKKSFYSLSAPEENKPGFCLTPNFHDRYISGRTCAGGV